MTFISLGSY